MDRGAGGQRGGKGDRLGRARGAQGGASSELHSQLIWTVGSGGRRLGRARVGSLLLPLTQCRDSVVKETEVD